MFFSVSLFGKVDCVDVEDFDWGGDLMGKVRKKLLSLKDFMEITEGRKGESFLSLWFPSFSAEAFASYYPEANEYSYNAARCSVSCDSFKKKLWWIPWWVCRRWKHELMIPVVQICFKGYIKKKGDGKIKWNEGCYVGVVDAVCFKEAQGGNLKRAEEKVRDFCDKILSL
ncbi:MAG: hypothetical protein WC435_03970 [Candidatus Paceibacterota bacterium]